MARSLDELTKEVLALPSASRAILAEKLVESLEFDVDEEIQSAWLDEAEKRIEELRTGKVQPIPGEEVLAEVRETAKRNCEEMLMEKLSKTEAVVWSPQTDSTGDRALSERLEAIRKETKE